MGKACARAGKSKGHRAMRTVATRMYIVSCSACCVLRRANLDGTHTGLTGLGSLARVNEGTRTYRAASGFFYFDDMKLIIIKFLNFFIVIMHSH